MAGGWVPKQAVDRGAATRSPRLVLVRTPRRSGDGSMTAIVALAISKSLRHCSRAHVSSLSAGQALRNHRTPNEAARRCVGPGPAGAGASGLQRRCGQRSGENATARRPASAAPPLHAPLASAALVSDAGATPNAVELRGGHLGAADCRAPAPQAAPRAATHQPLTLTTPFPCPPLQNSIAKIDEPELPESPCRPGEPCGPPPCRPDDDDCPPPPCPPGDDCPPPFPPRGGPGHWHHKQRHWRGKQDGPAQPGGWHHKHHHKCKHGEHRHEWHHRHHHHSWLHGLKHSVKRSVKRLKHSVGDVDDDVWLALGVAAAVATAGALAVGLALAYRRCDGGWWCVPAECPVARHAVAVPGCAAWAKREAYAQSQLSLHEGAVQGLCCGAWRWH